MASKAPKPFARPYKDFLTPLLHRQFTSAALLTIGVCYIESVWISGAQDMWSWIPLGPAGLRTLLLFISALAVFILRVANMHVGIRTTSLSLSTLPKQILNSRTVSVVTWYSFSALFYCEIYIWSQSLDTNLSTVHFGRSYERNKLNERPIYLRTMFLLASLLQSYNHLVFDYDKLNIPVQKVPAIESVADPNKQPVPFNAVREKLPAKVGKAALRSLGVTVVGFFLYVWLLRTSAFGLTHAVAQYVFDLPHRSRPPSLFSFIGDLFVRFGVQCFLLFTLWDFINLVFTEYVSQAPVKNGQTLTSAAKDPNGSLIAGLKAKKEIPRTAAFWELLAIAYSFPARRTAIYEDIDRGSDTAWSQISIVCQAEVHAIVKRIQDFESPPKPFSELPKEEIKHLPKISSQQMKVDEKIYTASPPPKGAFEITTTDFGKFAKAHGQFPGGDSLSPRAKQLLTLGADAVLTKEQQAALSPTGITSMFHFYIVKILEMFPSLPLRQTFATRARAVVLGTPTGNASVPVDAIYAYAKLAACSLTEDKYGNVAKDVPNMVRTYTSTVSKIDGFMKTLQPHWTDLDFSEKSRSEVKEIAAIQVALRTSLADLLRVFGTWLPQLGLSTAELRLAREASAAL